ncbi:hypothetical protein BMS3Abin03_02688 [bacterium BMS3Abin03]|nr:hypothetical protein BMS3Abin03_02688 [bacterium BMS3Abin03]
MFVIKEKQEIQNPGMGDIFYNQSENYSQTIDKPNLKKINQEKIDSTF